VLSPAAVQSKRSVRRYWHQLRSALARRIRYRITRGGILFSLAILVVGLGAVVSANNLLFLILAAMMATLLVSGVVSRLCLAALELDFVVPEHVPAGRSVPGKLFVRNQKWFMPSFSIRVEAVRNPASPVLHAAVYFPLVAGGATLEETIDVRFPRRGTYRQNSFAFSTSFPFGFLEKSARVTLQREMIVYPAIDPQPGFDDLLAGITGELETHYRGIGKDFYRIRPYEAFESARHVDWKATAHTGVLQVREFARDEEPLVEILLDIDVPASQADWFERAVECCAFLTWRLAQREARVRFSSQEFGMTVPAMGDIYTILKYLALVVPKSAELLPGPVEESSFHIVFTAAPEKFAHAAWSHARFVGPEAG
jgi:uncharacterized protein (DUF58 family)